jgi:hypothetical protein
MLEVDVVMPVVEPVEEVEMEMVKVVAMDVEIIIITMEM